MRIAIKPLPQGGAVSWFRGTGPGEELKALGHEVCFLHSKFHSHEEQRELVRTADVVHVLGCRAQSLVAPDGARSGHWKDAPAEFKERRGVLSMDLDDDVWVWLDDPAKKIADAIGMGALEGKGDAHEAIKAPTKERLAEITSWLEAADLVTTTTPYLAGRIAERVKGPEIRIVQNAVAKEMERRRPKRSVSEVLRKAKLVSATEKVVAWTGSVAHVPDLPPVLEALARVRRVDGSIVVRSLGPVDFMRAQGFREAFSGTNDYTPVVWRDTARPEIPPQPQVHFELYYDFLEAMAPDVAVIPMRDSDFNRSKSAVTLYSWAIQKVPVICSDTGPYKAAREEGFPAIYVAHGDVDAWTRELRALLYEPARALALGERAFAWVTERHSFPKAAEEWAGAWTDAMARKKVPARERAATKAP